MQEGHLLVFLEPGCIHEEGDVVLGQEVSRQVAELTPGVVAARAPLLDGSDPTRVLTSQQAHPFDIGVSGNRAQVWDRGGRVEHRPVSVDVNQHVPKGMTGTAV